MSTFAPSMREQVLATPSALLDAFDTLERTARLVLTTPQIYRTRRILLTGSGDSYFAAKAAEFAFMAHAGLPVEMRSPLDAGRYHAQLADRRDLENTLVIALSNSGAAARVAEAATLYRAAGAPVLAVTKAEKGRLAGIASQTLVLPIPELPPGPGFGPYLFAQTALLLLAIRIGEVRMRITMDEAQALRASLKATIAAMAASIEAADTSAAALCASVLSRPIVEFLGAGPDFAVADYGAAKLFEAVGHHAYARDLEEWTHLNYFDGRPEEIATVLVIAANSRAQSRAVELLDYMNRLGRMITVVGGGPAADKAIRLGHTAIAVSGDVDELWSPMLLSAPLALIAAHAPQSANRRLGSERWADSADASTVQKSEMWEPRT
ncbi:SIS domain-containing protein [Mesorhizobium sp. BR1-1-16]|uniref:SIS domain-containing protein n=1 Tax=Mesorhizobium sp. BR1-1-16 TaxID=2876653 RepID=UPI001CCD212D|nr:SIS domain-containing protein [Mesorhizobium sp. BR1-1-16]MBZ9938571.1 SIS domain-containing protein [Mesorhizobium sp. BR1-1-16]